MVFLAISVDRDYYASCSHYRCKHILKKNPVTKKFNGLIGAVSAHTGVNIETIRYYERIGIMPSPARTPGKQRIYNEAQLKRLDFIKRSRDLGFSLDEIRALLELADNEKLTCKQVASLTEGHMQEVQKKILDLQNIESALGDLLGQCTGGDTPECPIFDTLYGAYADKAL